MLDHPNFFTLSTRAVKLLIDIASQYRGTNNGDLCATYSVLRKRGWTSNDQIQKGLNELLDRGWLIKTRQGRRPRVASLFAITWEPIDDCGGKLEVPATKTAPNDWRQDPPSQLDESKSDGRVAVQVTPGCGAMATSKTRQLNRHAAHTQ